MGQVVATIANYQDGIVDAAAFRPDLIARTAYDQAGTSCRRATRPGGSPSSALTLDRLRA
jgi:hypothetical protein